MMRQFDRLFGAVILTWLAALAPTALAGSHDLPAAADLRAEAARAARGGGPLIVVFTRPDCSWCETVKRDYLRPLAAHPRYRGHVVVRQIDQEAATPLTGFHGEATTQAAFAAAEKIRLVPVVAFYGPDGQRLAAPIVGARLPDFYQTYLEEAIDHSALALKPR